MKSSVTERAEKLGLYIVENNATVRKTAEVFGVSKSTVHMDVAKRLKNINLGLYHDVRKILEKNKAERHIRGGMATKQKFLNSNK